MPSPEIGVEAGKAGAFTALGMVALHAFNFFTRRMGAKASTQQAELDATLRASGALREEYRKENEELRDRLTRAEKRIDDLEDELHAVRDANEKLRRENERIETELRMKVSD